MSIFMTSLELILSKIAEKNNYSPRRSPPTCPPQLQRGWIRIILRMEHQKYNS